MKAQIDQIDVKVGYWMTIVTARKSWVKTSSVASHRRASDTINSALSLSLTADRTIVGIISDDGTVVAVRSRVA